ncbi:tagaturonate reductase [Selenomonas sp. TAMA-11512]|uniref:tagaturonate reductase n=1 Tax=Selenomonas sp. TAMA-11512 TaxID=3095337 RepID=UPI003085F027|nr:tagaturonate reductase [Selenomonas sp. TAMA-11512]
MKEIQEIYSPEKHLVRILQFGEGNFLRAFVDYAVDVANEENNFDASVAVIIPRANARPQFAAQKNIYTVCLRGQQKGTTYKENRVVRCIDRVLSAHSDYHAYMQVAEIDTLRFVVSNTTEAGIVFDSDSALADTPPKAFPAKLTQFLYARFRHFKGAADKGLHMLPTELIENNGQELRRCVTEYVKQWKLGTDFAAWIDSACTFTDTLVDRIVVGYPQAEAAQYEAELGYRDALLCQAEPFSLWVIGSEALADELPIASSKFNAVFTSDVAKYKECKVRILNGAHTSMALGAYLAGFDYVGDCMKDSAIRAQLDQSVYGEIVPTVHLSEADARAFAEAVFERFDNPFVHHVLLSISLNSISKWRARVLPSLKDSFKNTGKLPKWLTYSLAALLAFYHTSEQGDGCLIGHRGKDMYEIHDDADKLKKLAVWATLPAQEYVHNVLAAKDFWGEDLTRVAGLETKVKEHFERIAAIGARAHIKELGKVL